MKADRGAGYDKAVEPRVDAGHGQVAGGYGHDVLLAVIGGLIGLYGWLLFVMVFDRDLVIARFYNAAGADYMVYWTAARAALAGKFASAGRPGGVHR